MKGYDDITPWVVPLRREGGPDIEATWFCFPYAGGSAAVFRSWTTDLSFDIDPYGIELPGRAKRFHDPLHTRMATIVDELTEALLPWLKRPFVFIGYSLGTLISFEVYRRLRERGYPLPRLLMVGAHRAPHLPDRTEPIHQLPDSLFIDQVRRYGGTPAEVLADEELLHMLLPMIRADFEVSETYEYVAGEPLACPILVMGGRDDPTVTEEELHAWAEHTHNWCKVEIVPGDHFFLHTSRALMVSRLLDETNTLIK